MNSETMHSSCDRPFDSASERLLKESRRAFLKHGALILAGSVTVGSARRVAFAAGDEDQQHRLRIGVLTDCHYADKNPAGSRHYRDSLPKLKEAVAEFKRSRADFAVEMGDFIDAAGDVQTEIGYLKTIDREFAKFKGDRHYVLGNHCVNTLTKQEFIENSGAKKPHYSFDKNGFHFVVLDACYRNDGVGYERENFDWKDTNISTDQVKWLERDLTSTKKNAIVFVHQRLDTSDPYSIKNAKTVRSILEGSQKVKAVFQGHTHQNDYREIGGIHYCTLRAVVEDPGAENSGYALVDIYDDGSIRVDGFRRQKEYRWLVT